MSDRAIRVGGYIDSARPHCANQIKVGNLGTYEILLICCDDGDVLAFYTRVISAMLDLKDFGSKWKPNLMTSNTPVMSPIYFTTVEIK